MTDGVVDLASRLVERALASGASAADAVATLSEEVLVNRRLGKLEDLDRSESLALGLRVFCGHRQASVATTDPSPDTAGELVERAVAMARLAPEDHHAGLADARLLADGTADLDLDGGDEPGTDTLTQLAAEAEDAALAVSGITNSEGATAAWQRATGALVTSTGFAGVTRRTMSSLYVTVIAGTGLDMQSDGEGRSARHLEDLPTPADIGREAAERAVRRLDPHKLATARMPLVFEPRTARSLVGHLAGFIAGPAIARGTSWLKDSLDCPVFAEGIIITEDPSLRRGLASRSFDGEGLQPHAGRLVDNGVLVTWLLDCRSARQLSMHPTGHAIRGTGGPPSVGTTNLWLEAGEDSPDALMADIDEGLYVTSLSGHGINPVTGDYSRGASGQRIRNGSLDHAVNEITIAGNLKEIYASLLPASDLEFRAATNSPSIRVDTMTVAGSVGG